MATFRSTAAVTRAGGTADGRRHLISSDISNVASAGRISGTAARRFVETHRFRLALHVIFRSSMERSAEGWAPET
jgi:hypothetical protein